MKIGIIVYSGTGHTFSVTEKLNEKFLSLGYESCIKMITTKNPLTDTSNINSIELDSCPRVEEYDVLVFAAPVMAFAACPVIAKYLLQPLRLNNKKIFLFVTKALPFKTFGGNNAISKMKKLCIKNGGEVIDSEIIPWTKNREKNINELIERFSKEI